MALIIGFQLLAVVSCGRDYWCRQWAAQGMPVVAPSSRPPCFCRVCASVTRACDAPFCSLGITQLGTVCTTLENKDHSVPGLQHQSTTDCEGQAGIFAQRTSISPFCWFLALSSHMTLKMSNAENVTFIAHRLKYIICTGNIITEFRPVLHAVILVTISLTST